jgi:hypothetical protein
MKTFKFNLSHSIKVYAAIKMLRAANGEANFIPATS